MSDKFRRELENLLNSHCKENISDTPDFILAKYLIDCLAAFDQATLRRTTWYNKLPGTTEAMKGTVNLTKEDIIPDANTVVSLGQTSKELKTHLDSPE